MTTPTTEVGADMILSDFPLQVGQVRWYLTEWEYIDHVDEAGNLVYDTSTYYTAQAIIRYDDPEGIPTYTMQRQFCDVLNQDLSTCGDPGDELTYEVRDNSIWLNAVKMFEWPLELGRTWEDEFSKWEIYGLVDIATKIGQFDECYSIGERTSHGWSAYVLCPGIGIVQERAGGPSESVTMSIAAMTLPDN